MDMITINKAFDDVYQITVKTPDGEVFEFLSIGASLIRWQMSDGTDIVAAYQDLNDYYRPGMYLGTTVGPLAGRISRLDFSISGTKVQIVDSVPNFLHSGHLGLSFRNFRIKEIRCEDETFLVSFQTEYSHPSLPGEVLININYKVKDGALDIEFLADSSEDTILNLTNHSYFNLDGDFSGNLDNHVLKINASRVVLVDEQMLGKEIIGVGGTVFDLRTPKPLKDVIDRQELKLQGTNGLDHYFLLDRERDCDIELASLLSGRKLKVSSTYPGITVYTTNMPKDTPIQQGQTLAFHGAVALEPQYQSNAINDHRFENYLLHKGLKYHHQIKYRLEEKA